MVTNNGVYSDEQMDSMKMCDKAISNMCQGLGRCRHAVKHLPNADCKLKCSCYSHVSCQEIK
jgi:hypothetical protein